MLVNVWNVKELYKLLKNAKNAKKNTKERKNAMEHLRPLWKLQDTLSDRKKNAKICYKMLRSVKEFSQDL